MTPSRCYDTSECKQILTKMAFTDEDKTLIKVLRQEKGYGARRLIAEFPNKRWTLSGVSKLIKKIDATGTTDRKKGSGGRRTVRTDVNIEAVENLILSQESEPGTHRTIREITRETNISKSTVYNIVSRDLKLKCFKKHRAQELSDKNKLTRLVCAKQLLKRYPEHAVDFIWFTDEKVFSVASPVNTQNDRVYAAYGTKKKQLPAARLLRTRSTFSKSVMVSVGVSFLGTTPLIFIEPGVKINGAYYRGILRQQLLPAIRSVSGNFFTFQQDNALSHRAHETIRLLTEEAPDFISPALWPANSPDLNPVDYKIWGVLQERVYRRKIRDVDHLKEILTEEWNKFDQSIISEAVRQWRPRLRACIRERGGHFEHTF